MATSHPKRAALKQTLAAAVTALHAWVHRQGLRGYRHMRHLWFQRHQEVPRSMYQALQTVLTETVSVEGCTGQDASGKPSYEQQ